MKLDDMDPEFREAWRQAGRLLAQAEDLGVEVSPVLPMGTRPRLMFDWDQGDLDRRKLRRLKELLQRLRDTPGLRAVVYLRAAPEDRRWDVLEALEDHLEIQSPA